LRGERGGKRGGEVGGESRKQKRERREQYFKKVLGRNWKKRAQKYKKFWKEIIIYFPFTTCCVFDMAGNA
jgi:hypothetical protein